MRRPIIAGNWKMNLKPEEAMVLVTVLKSKLKPDISEQIEVVVCPPFTLLSFLKPTVRSGSGIKLGAQDVFWEPNGAYTGEISASMLKDVFCDYCIIGHSERRQYLGETDEQVRKKLSAALREELIPILCVGETLSQRKQGETLHIIETQLTEALGKLSAPEMSKIVIAYEPVWAIGTGQNATAGQAQEAHAFIRQWLTQRWGEVVAQGIRIQYGGSVKAANTETLMREADVDGALVGGASLEPESFAAIIEATTRAKIASQRTR